MADGHVDVVTNANSTAKISFPDSTVANIGNNTMTDIAGVYDPDKVKAGGKLHELMHSDRPKPKPPENLQIRVPSNGGGVRG